MGRTCLCPSCSRPSPNTRYGCHRGTESSLGLIWVTLCVNVCVCLWHWFCVSPSPAGHSWLRLRHHQQRLHPHPPRPAAAREYHLHHAHHHSRQRLGERFTSLDSFWTLRWTQNTEEFAPAQLLIPLPRREEGKWCTFEGILHTSSEQALACVTICRLASGSLHASAVL